MKRIHLALASSAAALLVPTTKVHAELLIDFPNASSWNVDYVTDEQPGNIIQLRVLNGAATYSGSISGSGNIYKSGAGHLLMTGTYSHQGGTTAREGIMDLTGSIPQTLSVGVGWNNLAGELRVRAGASITSGPVFIGPFSDSLPSSALVDGPTTTWTVVPVVTPAADPGNLRVGDYNDGSLTIQNGALVSSVRGIIGGRDAGAAGSATVTGTNSRWLNSERLLVGNTGTGNLTISAGGRVENSFARLGELVGSSGTVLVTGANSTWASSGDLFIGNNGSGTLTVSSAGTVTSDGLARLGDHTGSSGTTTVTGTGSSWANNGAIYVGNNGTGSLTISAGGAVTSNGTSILGNQAGSSGSVGVTGAGSSWSNDGALVIGDNDVGSLTIGAAGQVTTDYAIVGSFAGSDGTVHLDGTAGSQGLFTTAQLRTGDGTALLNWNGGILRATESRNDFLHNFAAGEIDVQAGGAFIDSNGFDVGSNSALAGVGGFAKSGTGILNFTGIATLGGVTAINGGGLTIDAGGSITTSGLGVARAAGTTGVLRVSGTNATLDGGGFITVGDGSGSTGTLTVDGGGLVRMAPGAKLTVGWLNAIGTVNLDAGGTIEVGGTDGIQKHGTGTANIHFGGGKLRVVNTALTTALPITLVAGNSTIDTNGLNATLSGGLSGTGGLVKIGNGNLTLNAASSYSGTTQVDNGTLIAGVAGAFGTSKPFIVNGGLLDLNGNTVKMSSLSGNGGTVFIGTGTLEVDGSVTATYAGSVSGSGNFVMKANAILNLTGASSFLGTTSVNNGYLRAYQGGTFTSFGIGVGRAAASSGILVATGAGSVLTATSFLTVGDGPGSTGQLVIENSGRVSLGAGAKLTVGWENATGSLYLYNSGILEIGGTNGLQKHPTGTSNVNLSGGTIRVVHQNLTTAVNIAVTTSSSTIDTNGFDATISGALSGNGSLTKTGAGNLVLSGAISQLGEARVQTGVLRMTRAARFPNASSVRIDPGAVLHLDFAGSDTVSALYLGGVKMPDGSYGSLSSAAANKSADFSGDGILMVGTYETWAALHNVLGGPHGDSNGNGVANLVEYALADGAERGDFSGNTLSFTKRGSPYAGDLIYQIESSTDLAEWDDLAKPPVVENAGSISYTLTPGTPEKHFIRLKVVQVP